MTYLSTYRALVRNKYGIEAISRYGIPPYVDGSCRREPDFESQFPSISTLCHGKMFAPRLNPKDRVVYFTKKGRYQNFEEPHWRFVAILQVSVRFENHDDAAQWYLGKKLPLPSNCMVKDNPPLSLQKTDLHKKSLEQWDRGYQYRAKKWGTFLACEILYLELYNPPVITQDQMLSIFDRIPATRNPPAITEVEYLRLTKFLEEIS